MVMKTMVLNIPQTQFLLKAIITLNFIFIISMHLFFTLLQIVVSLNKIQSCLARLYNFKLHRNDIIFLISFHLFHSDLFLRCIHVDTRHSSSFTYVLYNICGFKIYFFLESTFRTSKIYCFTNTAALNIFYISIYRRSTDYPARIKEYYHPQIHQRFSKFVFPPDWSN